jgi:hypothetical protein
VKNYSDELLRKTKAEMMKQFESLLQYNLGKLTVNFNKWKGEIEIVPEPHIRFSEKREEK